VRGGLRFGWFALDLYSALCLGIFHAPQARI